MRIGVSGTHGTGKTTLAGELCARLAGHVVIDEPYVLLEDEGYEFAFPPSADDYRAQLARSVQMLSPSSVGVVFDRTPADSTISDMMYLSGAVPLSLVRSPLWIESCVS